MQTVVYKIGGSLFSLPDLAVRLQRLIAIESGQARLLIVSGGGATADIVRGWDRVHGLGEERAHWLALESLRLNERLLAELLPGSRIVGTRDAAEHLWRDGRPAILCAADFVRAAEEEGRSTALPHSWNVTSDSIAAWVAAVWPADRLVLVKSVACDEGRRQAATPLVDSHFPMFAPYVRDIGWVNLRDDAMPMQPWPGR